MWWPWKTKKEKRDRESASVDGTSLGNLLLKAGMITAEQLQEALDFQDENPDHMLGEALVQMGVVDKDTVETLIETQKARRTKHDGAVVIEIAKNRKGRLYKAHDQFVSAALMLGKVDDG